MTAARAPSAPADYTAPPLSGTTATPNAKAGTLVDIVRDPADLPPPIGARGPRRIDVNLYTEEVTGKLADGATYHYWTFNGKVPGPFVRVRVGDVVHVRLTNDASSMMMHNVDFHAVLGPGGGGPATMAGPGESKGFTFKAVHPGLYVYHCATQPVAQHIANGMYGMILIEPEGGLPKVDHEYYVMQGEIYTQQKFGTTGLLNESYDKLLAETPEYFTFNGAVGALTDHKPLKSKVGQTVRIYFGDAGPNKTSSFHVIGQVFGDVYNLGSLTAPPLTDVQTVTVPPGGSVAVEITTQVPGHYMIMDHALARAERGLVGMLNVEGPAAPDLFQPDAPEKTAMQD
jgi:nitrite reductase (NO-forming)